MRQLLVLGLLLGGAAYAQKASCEDRCMAHDNCFEGCSDQRCMTRCQQRSQSCVQDCMKKNMEQQKSGSNKKGAQGFCAGPGGKRVRCDSYMPPDGTEDDVRKKLAHPEKDKGPSEEDNKKYNRPPTQDEIDKLMK